MMRRILCAWFPNWPVQRLLAEQPKFRNRPLVVFAEQGGKGLRVSGCSPEAKVFGVESGQTLADARAFLQVLSGRRGKQSAQPALKKADPVADLRALRQLAIDCQQFSPLVGLEEGDTPESLLFDVAGCAHLFDDEPGLVNALSSYLASRGIHARISIADTIGSAWALAHAGRPVSVIPNGQTAFVIKTLPVTALRISPTVADTLNRLDVRTIGDLQKLPRSSLPSRFGKELVKRLDQATGQVWEDFTPERLAEPLTASWQSDDPAFSQEGLTFLFRRLLGQLLALLAPKRSGILDLVCELTTETQTIRLAWRLLRPTIDEKHLTQLFELRCEREQCGGQGVFGFRLVVERAGWLKEQQTTLFDVDDSAADREVALLAERLASRLGEHAVLRLVRRPDPMPEYSLRLIPWLSKDESPSVTRNPSRPWRLFPTPFPIETTAVVPEGPPLRMAWQGQMTTITKTWGPERIESGWWRAKDEQRDYYRAESERGTHFWIFRQRATGRWFLHGLFD